jgi:hypothetical protein
MQHPWHTRARSMRGSSQHHSTHGGHRRACSQGDPHLTCRSQARGFSTLAWPLHQMPAAWRVALLPLLQLLLAWRAARAHLMQQPLAWRKERWLVGYPALAGQSLQGGG